ncbi:helix-turn-helix domain-containing protein [Micromonospora sp. NPDC002575]|uniref:helix-turn-helix domain-containing protein n=1 Tax=Micromonospora sp. NPDC002575 TaxID=3364222 RepID=UPI0036A8C897
MSADFARVLHGLMQNRRLSARAVSRATGRAESTLNQLLTGKLQPTRDILRDLAPVLQLDTADLFVIADLCVDSENVAREPYPATVEIGQLVAAASFLTPPEVTLLVQSAKALRRETQEHRGGTP